MFGGTGLRWSGAAASGFKQRLSMQQRSISSFNQTQRAFRPSLAQCTPAWRPTPRTTPLLRSATFARFNSNASTSAAAATTTPSLATTTQSPLESLETTISHPHPPPDAVLTEIPERIGYLSEMGLDFGWGPSSMTQWLFEHVHIYTGLPWWVSIAVSAAIVRALIWKPIVDASDAGARMRTLSPIMKPLQTQLSAAVQEGDQAAVMRVREAMSKIRRDAGVSMTKTLGGLLMLPAAFASFRVLRAMADLPVPAIEFEKFAWVDNMAMADPTYILPALTAGVTVLSIKTAGKMQGPTSLMNNPLVTTVLPLVTFMFVYNWAAFMQVYFLTSGLLGLFQNSLLASSTFRSKLNLCPLPNTSPADDKPAFIPPTAAEKRYLAGVSSIDKAIWYASRYAEGHQRKFMDQVKSAMNMAPETPAATTAAEQAGKMSRAGKGKMSKEDLERANEYEQRRRAEQKYVSQKKLNDRK